MKENISKIRKILRLFFDKFEWIHLCIGIFGNLTFVTGSIFFLFEELKTAAIYLFIVGSSFMLIGSVGQALVRYVYRKQERENKNNVAS